MGGLATAAALRRVGVDVTVYEQARHFDRVGAGIQIGCNAMKVLRALGLEPSLRAAAFYPRSWNNRDFDTGKIRFDMIFGEAAEERYGAPSLLAHRGDLHAALTSIVPDCQPPDRTSSTHSRLSIIARKSHPRPRLSQRGGLV